MLTLLPLGVAATPASLLARTIYFGDLHTHSEASFDGTGSVEGLFTLGRDVIGLDFDNMLLDDDGEATVATLAVLGRLE